MGIRKILDLPRARTLNENPYFANGGDTAAAISMINDLSEEASESTTIVLAEARAKIKAATIKRDQQG